MTQVDQISTRPLKSISAFITKGATPTTYGFKWEAAGVPFLRSECVSARGLDMKQAMFISPEADAALQRSRVRDGDILMTITGYVGRVIRLRGLPSANINQHIARIRVNDAAFDAGYVFHYLSQPWIKANYETITTGQAYPQISLTQVRDTEIPALSLREQAELAKALDDTDDLTATLERLIAKKRAIKQGMMQELLTGRTRLPGFEGDWILTRLGKVLRFQAGFPFSSDGFSSSANGLRLVRNRDLRSDDAIVHFVLPYSSEFLLSNGDLLVGMDGEFEPVVWRGGSALLNQRVGRLQVGPRADTAFLAYALLEPLRALQGETGATTVKHLSHRDVESIEMLLPTVDEQEQIGLVLASADAEIEALERRLETTRAIKQGMMQELLTGRTRLVAPEEATV